MLDLIAGDIRREGWAFGGQVTLRVATSVARVV
jgi:hypothetical protein